MSREIRIRMYNVGFGDCFLLTFPTRSGKKRVLIDCGCHVSGRGPHSMDEIARRIADDVKADGGTQIDVVIATHRHYDHISGFSSAVWDEVEVGEVWLPWTEGDDDGARGLMARFDRLTRLLEKVQGLDEGVQGLVMNAASNAKAMATLKEGFASGTDIPRRYFPETDAYPEVAASTHLPGVKVHVLGPPLDEDVIARDMPPVDETFRHLSGGSAAAGVAAPFADAWSWVPPDGKDPLFPNEKAVIRTFNELDFISAAHALDSVANNTSLVLVFEIGRAVLLFPGDAQWGTWEMALQNTKARALLERTTFLKVGHHGSHNATPKSFVNEPLPTGVPAMISTQEGDGKWRNNIPLGPLLDALTEREVSFARSDDPDSTPQNFTWDDDKMSVEISIPC